MVFGPDLVGCRLVKRQADGNLLWGVIVETEAYTQDDPAYKGYFRRSPQKTKHCLVSLGVSQAI